MLSLISRHSEEGHHNVGCLEGGRGRGVEVLETGGALRQLLRVAAAVHELPGKLLPPILCLMKTHSESAIMTSSFSSLPRCPLPFSGTAANLHRPRVPGSGSMPPASRRYESLKHCKWVDEVVEDAPWVVDEDFLAVHQVMLECHVLRRWCCGIGGGYLTCAVVLHSLSGVVKWEGCPQYFCIRFKLCCRDAVSAR